jgi:hypothetical protein
MNKPEFPKPTLIREDFMPERDITTEYRIKKITKGDKVEFRAQRKYLWWWINLGDYSTDNYDWAIYRIKSNIQKRAKFMIEYLDVTPDELAPRTPNPPPKNP